MTDPERSTPQVQEGSRTAIVAALLANLAIAIAKFAGFLATGATSMLAEAVHSVADTTNQGLLFLGGSRSRRPATPEHPFGHGRERYFWAFVVAAVIFTVGSLFALYEGVEKLRHPHAPESVTVAVAILLVALVVESLSLRTAVRESRHLRGEGSWWDFIRRSKEPELPVVLLEDSGALVGLVFALLGVGLAHLTGEARLDALGSIAIGVLLGCIAVTLMAEMKSLLIGEAASPPVLARIRRIMEADEDVRRLIHMRTEHLGPDELLVGAKVELVPTLDVIGVARTINRVEEAVRAAVPQARVIYLEPDITSPQG
jgi:cation diffusion facilitator family transporter